MRSNFNCCFRDDKFSFSLISPIIGAFLMIFFSLLFYLKAVDSAFFFYIKTITSCYNFILLVLANGSTCTRALLNIRNRYYTYFCLCQVNHVKKNYVKLIFYEILMQRNNIFVLIIVIAFKVSQVN